MAVKLWILLVPQKERLLSGKQGVTPVQMRKDARAQGQRSVRWSGAQVFMLAHSAKNLGVGGRL